MYNFDADKVVEALQWLQWLQWFAVVAVVEELCSICYQQTSAPHGRREEFCHCPRATDTLTRLHAFIARMDGRQHLCLRTSLGKPALALSMQSKPFLIGYNKSAQGDTPAKQTHTHGRMDTHSTSTRTHAHTHTCRNVRCCACCFSVKLSEKSMLSIRFGYSCSWSCWSCCACCACWA